MKQNTRVTFAMRDLDRLKCIQAVVDGDLKPHRAAERLGLTSRQVRRLARRYATAGPAGLISKRFNRPSNNRLDDDTADRVIKLLRSTYADFGPTLAPEKLRTKHGIDLAKETVRRLQIAVGLWIPRKLRPPKIQQPRLRRACIGELVQIDGCEHHWFEDRGPACTALVYIDDATSRLMQILFTRMGGVKHFAHKSSSVVVSRQPTKVSRRGSIFRSANVSFSCRHGIGRYWRRHRGWHQVLCASLST